MISASWSIWTRRFALVYGARSYFSAMLGSTVDTICVRLRIFSYSSAMLGLTVDTYVARRRVGSGMVFAGLLVTMIRAGGHVHRDMTPIIRCIRAVVSTKTLLLHLQPTTTNYNQLQPTTTNCNQLQPTATNCNQLQPTATNCNQLQPTATNCNQLTATN